MHTCCALDWGWYAESISIHTQVGIWMFSDPAFTAISVLALVYNDYTELSQELLWQENNSGLG